MSLSKMGWVAIKKTGHAWFWGSASKGRLVLDA